MLQANQSSGFDQNEPLSVMKIIHVENR